MSTINVSSFVFNKIKIEAKKLKATHPSLSHMQRLDEASRRVAKVRHFHEAKKLHDKYLDLYSFTNNSTTRLCPYCQVNFCPDSKSDVIEHGKIHRAWEEAEYYMNYLPLNYEGREKLKREGYDRVRNYQNSFTFDEVIHGAYMLLRAYYDRSLSNSIDVEVWPKHPKFEKYIALVNHESVFPKDVSNYFREKYGRESSRQKNYWFPA